MTFEASSSDDVRAGVAPDRGASYRSVWSYLMELEFRQGYVDVDGLRTRFVNAGSPDSPPLIMVHGTGGHWEAFSANVGALSAQFNCFAFDMLGCGFTDKPDRPYEIKDYVAHLLGLMNAMDITTASFIGVSLGSWVISRLAHDHPDRVTRMILNAPSGFLPQFSAATQAAAGQRRETMKAPTWESTTDTFAALFYRRETVIDDLVAVRQRVYGSPAFQAAAGRTMTLFDAEVRERNLITPEEWQEIEAPTLLIAHVDSDDDWLATARALAPLLPNGVLVEMTEVSHWPQFERPDAFNALALEFLSTGRIPE